MLDVQKFKGKIVEKGKSIEILSRETGINSSAFYCKLNNNSFEINQVDRNARILSLTGAEATAIFLANISHKCNTTNQSKRI